MLTALQIFVKKAQRHKGTKAQRHKGAITMISNTILNHRVFASCLPQASAEWTFSYAI
jgi:hypothetical protein